MSTIKTPINPASVGSSTRAEAAEATPGRGKEGAPRVHEVEKMASNPETPHRDSAVTLAAPPLPEEQGETAPPVPMEAPSVEDDGWDPVWDDNAQAYYFHNRFTQQSQWTNPRVPDATQPAIPGVGNYDRIPDRAPGTEDPAPHRPYGGYDPAVHGDYDPTASYAQEPQAPEDVNGQPADPAAIYTATGVFNRFTGKWQPHDINPENHNDENKSKRQMSAFFDVDAAANSHNGKSLKAERSGKKLSKQELKAFKEKRKEKKEEKRRAWLRD